MLYSNLYPSKSYQADPFRRNGTFPRRPDKPLRDRNLPAMAAVPAAGIGALWLGHSAVLLRMNGLTLLSDPVFSRYVSPVPPFGPKRFPGIIPAASDLPGIDVVLITHSHYDHLDKATLRALKKKIKHYVVPAGIGAILRTWGISDDCITELNWWESVQLNGLQITCTPAQHNSARSLWDLNRTLWCSYVVRNDRNCVFFSGDTGFSPHFQDIAERYPKIDLAFMECGQYNAHWHHMHMFPEESVEACRILKTGLAVPVHWGAYSLAPHAWDEPPKRFADCAKQQTVAYRVPKLYEWMIF